MRVNMDSSINNEARFKLLAKQVGIPFLHGVGCCWAVWLNCYHSLSERLSICEANASADIDGFAQAMISVGLADAIGDTMMRVHGVKTRIEFLKKQRKKGSSGGKTRRKSDVSTQVASEANAKHMLAENSTSAQAYSPALALAPTPALTPSPTPSEKVEGTPPRFTAPTVEQVKTYCTERGNRIDPQKFVDYYSANGWRVGRNPMKDWRAAVRTWEKNDRERSPKTNDDKMRESVNDFLGDTK